MKIKTNNVLIAVALLAYWVGLCNAIAFYDPGQQRWLNRDPIGEQGFTLLQSRNSNLLRFVEMFRQIGGNNVYKFVRNQPTDLYDDRGLAPGSPTGPNSLACIAAGDQLQAAVKQYFDDPSEVNELLVDAAIAARDVACSPPPPPDPPNNSCPIIPPMPPQVKKQCTWAVVAGIAYWVCSEGSRLFPPRNLIPIL